MTSKGDYSEVFVWIWLPEETEPIVAGKLEEDDGNVFFNYSKSYLDRTDDVSPAMAIYEPELPLRAGVLSPPAGLNLAGCIRDASPDAWGRRVIINRKLGAGNPAADTAELSELAYLLESGSDRIGALDFQRSPSEYLPRCAERATLDELLESAERVEKGVLLTPELDQALFHASSIGGARPKVSLESRDKKYVAKFPLASDLYNLVKAEFVAMRLAYLAGLDVAPVQLVTVANKDVLLVERFDRKKVERGWQRKAMVSALTLLGLDDMTARYASYETLAEIVRRRFTAPGDTLRELFSRLVFNILCGNTDDHARNHSAFWDGESLSLTPAYDICPQARTGNEASQAMLISGDNNLARFESCLEAASNFLLSEEDARAVFASQKEAIEKNWDAVCDEARLSEVDRRSLWGSQFLNPFSVAGA